jgi:predicted RNase H-like HicB family nuclease
MKPIKLHITVEVDPESGWFTATCPVLPGCITQAETEAELIENMKEAISLWLEVEDEKQMASVSGKGTRRELALSF